MTNSCVSVNLSLPQRAADPGPDPASLVLFLLVKLRYPLTYEMTAQEHEMSSRTSKGGAVGSDSVQGPCGLANVLYYSLALVRMIIMHVFLCLACENWVRK